MVNRKKLFAYCLVCSFIQITICKTFSESSIFKSERKGLIADNRRNESPLYNIDGIVQVQQNSNVMKTKHFHRSRRKRENTEVRDKLTPDSIAPDSIDESFTSTIVPNEKYVSSTPEPVATMSHVNDEPVPGTSDTNIEDDTVISDANDESVSTTSEANNQPTSNIDDTNMTPVSIVTDVIDESVSTTISKDVYISSTHANEQPDSSTTVSSTPEPVAVMSDVNGESDSSTTVSNDKYVVSTSEPVVVLPDVNDEPVPGTRDTNIEYGVVSPAANDESASTSSKANNQPTSNIADANITPVSIVSDAFDESVSSTAKYVYISSTPANEESVSSTTVSNDKYVSSTLEPLAVILDVNDEPNPRTRDTNIGEGMVIPGVNEESPSTTSKANNQSTSNIADTKITPVYFVSDVIDESVSTSTVSKDAYISSTPASEESDSSTTVPNEKYVSTEPTAIMPDVNDELIPGTRDTNIEEVIVVPGANDESVSTTSEATNQPTSNIADANITPVSIVSDAIDESVSSTSKDVYISSIPANEESDSSTTVSNEKNVSSAPSANDAVLLNNPGQNIDSVLNYVDAKTTLNTSNANTEALNIPDEINEQIFNFPSQNINFDLYMKRLLKELYRRDIDEMKLFSLPNEEIGQSEKNIVEAIRSYNGVHHEEEADSQFDSTKDWTFGDISALGSDDGLYRSFENLKEPLIQLSMNNKYENVVRKSSYVNPRDEENEDRTLYSRFVNEFTDKSFTNDKYKSLRTNRPYLDNVDEEYAVQSEVVQNTDDTQDELFASDPPMYRIYDSEDIIPC